MQCPACHTGFLLKPAPLIQSVHAGWGVCSPFGLSVRSPRQPAPIPDSDVDFRQSRRPDWDIHAYSHFGYSQPALTPMPSSLPHCPVRAGSAVALLLSALQQPPDVRFHRVQHHAPGLSPACLVMHPAPYSLPAMVSDELAPYSLASRCASTRQLPGPLSTPRPHRQLIDLNRALHFAPRISALLFPCHCSRTRYAAPVQPAHMPTTTPSSYPPRGTMQLPVDSCYLTSPCLCLHTRRPRLATVRHLRSLPAALQPFVMDEEGT